MVLFWGFKIIFVIVGRGLLILSIWLSLPVYESCLVILHTTCIEIPPKRRTEVPRGFLFELLFRWTMAKKRCERSSIGLMVMESSIYWVFCRVCFFSTCAVICCHFLFLFLDSGLYCTTLLVDDVYDRIGRRPFFT